MRLSSTLTATAVLLLLAAGAAVQARAGDADELRAAVREWRSSAAEPGGAVSKPLAGWNVAKARAAAVAVARRDRNAPDAWSDAEVLAATLLLTSRGQSEMEAGGASWLWFDIARRLLGSVADAGRRQALDRDWVLALAALYQSRYDGLSAGRLLDDEAKAMWNEPDVVATAGRLHEAIASRAYSGAAEPVSSAATTAMETDLNEALRLFEHALALSPGRADLRLRRARVLSLLGRANEARRELEPLRGEAPDTDVPCLAALFLGAVHERQGHAREALACYRGALASGRSPQSARIAIARVLRASGDTAGARRVLEEMLADPLASGDAWWRYEREGFGEESHYEARLATLREAARQ